MSPAATHGTAIAERDIAAANNSDRHRPSAHGQSAPAAAGDQFQAETAAAAGANGQRPLQAKRKAGAADNCQRQQQATASEKRQKTQASSGAPAILNLRAKIEAFTRELSKPESAHKAAWALTQMTKNSEACSAVAASSQTITAILLLLGSGNNRDAVHCKAMALLLGIFDGNFSNPTVQAAVVAAGGIPKLVQAIIQCSDFNVRLDACSVLWHLVLGHEARAREAAAAVVQYQAIEALCRLLQEKTDRTCAVEFIGEIVCHCSAVAADQILITVLPLIRDHSASARVRTAAVAVVGRYCVSSSGAVSS